MNEMVDRVARAMLTADASPDGEVISPLCRTEEDICHLARAAIKILRDPTWPMRDAMGEALWRLLRSWEGCRTPTIKEIDDIWRAAIDAALEE